MQHFERRVAANKARIARALGEHGQAEQERAGIYMAGRAMGLTYRALGDLYGVTEAAVMQKVVRETARREALSPAGPIESALQ